MPVRSLCEDAHSVVSSACFSSTLRSASIRNGFPRWITRLPMPSHACNRHLMTTTYPLTNCLSTSHSFNSRIQTWRTVGSFNRTTSFYPTSGLPYCTGAVRHSKRCCHCDSTVSAGLVHRIHEQTESGPMLSRPQPPSCTCVVLPNSARWGQYYQQASTPRKYHRGIHA